MGVSYSLEKCRNSRANLASFYLTEKHQSKGKEGGCDPNRSAQEQSKRAPRNGPHRSAYRAEPSFKSWNEVIGISWINTNCKIIYICIAVLFVRAKQDKTKQTKPTGNNLDIQL